MEGMISDFVVVFKLGFSLLTLLIYSLSQFIHCNNDGL